ncbi:phage tail spike protein [Bacillus paramycoides]|uniref:phage tail spike protein n=1 Tax=Bacillus paramycoides TaxID=2026194 RepID=UPI002E1A7CAA|nr:phage tail spike protein [Bacillus paramycoides]MED1116472.1 phage tail spike protein [Bacillus paramycoides]
MRTPSGTLHVVDFQKEQIVSAIQPKDYWDDKRHWEIKNNIDTLEFKVFDNTEHAATLMQDNLVLKEVRGGRIVPYVIKEVEKDSDDRSVITYASGEWIQLAKAGIIPPQKLEGKTVNELLDMALVGTKWKRGETEYSGFHSMTIDEFIDPLSFLKKIASLFELEIQYRAEVVGSQIVGRYVDMVKKRGRDTGKEVTLGKDLMGIKRIENSQNICTALLGFVKKEGGEFITISDINNGVPYLVDGDAFQRWNERGQHKFGFYTPETEQDITPQRLLTLMKTEHKKRINTSISYDVQAQSIGRVFGLAHELINEGDTLKIKDTGFTPKLYLEARAIAGDESFKDPMQDKYVFGDYREIVDANEELRKMYNKILATLGSKANKELLDRLEQLVKENDQKANTAQEESQAAKKLAEKVQENLKQYQTSIIESKTAPTTGLEPGKTLWLDISNGKPGILKKWSGTEWEVLLKDYGKDVKDLDERTAEVQKSVKGLTSTVDQIAITTTDQGKQILEANSKIEQTSQKIEGKVDIKQVEDYVGGIGPTNEIRNTRFTKGTKYWGLASKFPAVVDQDLTHLGDFSLKLSVTGETAPTYNSFTSNRIPVTPGENVVVSAYFYTKNIDEHLNNKIRMVAVFWKSDGTQLTAGTNDFTIKNDTWTRQEFTKLAPPEAALVGFRAYVIQNGTMWVAHPMLQKGTKASSYIENPNDMVDKDKIIDDLADKIATADYNQKVTDIERRISATEKGVEISAKREETYTIKEVDGTFATGAYVKTMEGRIEVTENGIKNTVQKGNVISSINQSAEAFEIDAKRIGLKGFVTAEHIKGKVLEGVTLKTTGSQYVEINSQNFKICDTIKPRAYMGFAEATDGSGSIHPTFVLGSDNTKFNGAGAFYIFQTTPRINGIEQPSKAWATLGISKGNNAEGNSKWSSYIQMQNDGGHLYAYADGRLYFDCLNDIVFNSVGWAPGYGKFMVTTTEPHYFANNSGEFQFQRKGSGNKIYFSNGANDHDLVMGRVMIRSSLASGYDNGLQIKDTLGNAWRDMELRTLKANGNITATGGVWGREFIPNSSRKIKTNIEDLEFSALQKLNSVRIKKYNMISDVEKYNAGEIDVLPLYYGMIAEDSDNVFTTPEKNAVTLYSSVSITMQGVQEVDWKVDNVQFDIGLLKQQLETEKREKVFIQNQFNELKDLVVRQGEGIAKLEELLLQQLIDKKPEQP